MNAYGSWIRARLSGRPDSEHMQVMVRIAITSLFSAYLGWQMRGNLAGISLLAVSMPYGLTPPMGNPCET